MSSDPKRTLTRYNESRIAHVIEVSGYPKPVISLVRRADGAKSFLYAHCPWCSRIIKFERNQYSVQCGCKHITRIPRKSPSKAIEVIEEDEFIQRNSHSRSIAAVHRDAINRAIPPVIKAIGNYHQTAPEYQVRRDAIDKMIERSLSVAVEKDPYFSHEDWAIILNELQKEHSVWAEAIHQQRLEAKGGTATYMISELTHAFQCPYPRCDGLVEKDDNSCKICHRVFGNVVHLCSQCNSRVDEDAKKCSECAVKFGTPEGPASWVCSNCEGPVAELGYVRCKRCGIMLDNRSNVDEEGSKIVEAYECPNCEADVAPDATQCHACGVKYSNE